MTAEEVARAHAAMRRDPHLAERFAEALKASSEGDDPAPREG